MSRALVWVALAGLAGCGLGESEFRDALDGDVRVQCETCGGHDCAAPPRDTDDARIADDLCRFHAAPARRCLDAIERMTVDDCTDPVGAPGVFELPADCAEAFTCDAEP